MYFFFSLGLRCASIVVFSGFVGQVLLISLLGLFCFGSGALLFLRVSVAAQRLSYVLNFLSPARAGRGPVFSSILCFSVISSLSFRHAGKTGVCLKWGLLASWLGWEYVEVGRSAMTLLSRSFSIYPFLLLFQSILLVCFLAVSLYMGLCFWDVLLLLLLLVVLVLSLSLCSYLSVALSLSSSSTSSSKLTYCFYL